MSIEVKNVMMTGQDFSAQTGFLSNIDASPIYQNLSASIAVSGERERTVYREDNSVFSITTQVFSGTMSVNASRISVRDLEIYSAVTGIMEDGDVAEVSSTVPSGNFVMRLGGYMVKTGYFGNIDPTRPVASTTTPAGASTEIGTETTEYYDESGELIAGATEEYPILGYVTVSVAFLSGDAGPTYFMNRFLVSVISSEFSHIFEDNAGSWANSKWRDFRSTASVTESWPDGDWTTNSVSATFTYTLS